MASTTTILFQGDHVTIAGSGPAAADDATVLECRTLDELPDSDTLAGLAQLRPLLYECQVDLVAIVGHIERKRYLLSPIFSIAGRWHDLTGAELSIRQRPLVMPAPPAC